MKRSLHCLVVGGALALLLGCGAAENERAAGDIRAARQVETPDDHRGATHPESHSPPPAADGATAPPQPSGGGFIPGDVALTPPTSSGTTAPRLAPPDAGPPLQIEQPWPEQPPQMSLSPAPQPLQQPTPAIPDAPSPEAFPGPRSISSPVGGYRALPANPLRARESAPLATEASTDDGGSAAPVASMARMEAARMEAARMEAARMEAARVEAATMAGGEPQPALDVAAPPQPMAVEMSPRVEPAPMSAAPDDVDESSTKTFAPRALAFSAEPPSDTPQNDAADLQEPKAAALDRESDNYSVVEVFYGTDRRAVAGEARAEVNWLSLMAPISAAAASLGMLLLAWRFANQRLALGGLAVFGALIAAGLTWHELNSNAAASGVARVYGNQRGELEMGVCEVTIPKSHQQGQVESPSILRLELREDASRHIVLRSVTSKSEEAFFSQLKEAVAQSPQREVMVFVHGYNVSFEDAARRTGQMAHDLKLQGAPIFYSWPSQGGLLQYTVDETNVVWTVPHLKRFLLDVVRNSDAKAVNLIAHSMGNRALTAALRELSLELREESRLFHQVVLAAPDIDAEIFRRDIAPAIAQTAQGVTLYASSQDRALIASRRVHGYPRAGESRPNLMVLPEIETIDVSGVDTSVLGHSYYGASRIILDDIGLLFREGLPAAQRNLAPTADEGLTYWMFREAISDARPNSGGVLH